MDHKNLIPGLIILASAALGGCGSQGGKAPETAVNAQNIVAAADWSKSETVTVGVTSYAFSPANLSLRHGQPYKIHLANTSTHTHTFSSDDFFKTAAIQKVVKNGSPSSGLEGDGITLAPNDQVDLYLVPVTAGTYDLYCDEFMHDTMGMNGKITVQ
jgi:uncharacterized cupredoxin-like copper-binding protein